jgi:hypothetical protein
MLLSSLYYSDLCGLHVLLTIYVFVNLKFMVSNQDLHIDPNDIADTYMIQTDLWGFCRSDRWATSDARFQIRLWRTGRPDVNVIDSFSFLLWKICKSYSSLPVWGINRKLKYRLAAKRPSIICELSSMARLPATAKHFWQCFPKPNICE